MGETLACLQSEREVARKKHMVIGRLAVISSPRSQEYLGPGIQLEGFTIE